MYTNKTDIPLPFAVWLAADHGYDLKFDPSIVSATEILRPMRSIILSREVAAAKAVADAASDTVPTRDIAEKAAAALGTAVHTAVELAWTRHYKLAMANLDYPQAVIDRVQINPTDPDPNNLNMYFERRSSRQIEGFTLSGKFDIVMEDRVRDIKTTKVYTYIKGSQDDKYKFQGSIYRWLNPDIILQDTMIVDYYFTDWNPNNASKKDKENYPPNRMVAKQFTLLSLSDIEQFIRSQLLLIKKYTGKPQEDLPRCNPKELWQNPAQWEYWSKPTNKKCSNLFDSESEAMAKVADKGIGFIQERQFAPTFCLYCDARPVCTQAQEFIVSGLLKL